MSTLEDIKARLAAATPGPWNWDGDMWLESPDDYVLSNTSVIDRKVIEKVSVTDCDADFIANAPTDIARLIAALEVVESQCAYWDTMAPGDKYYAARIRYAINEALEQS